MDTNNMPSARSLWVNVALVMYAWIVGSVLAFGVATHLPEATPGLSVLSAASAISLVAIIFRWRLWAKLVTAMVLVVAIAVLDVVTGTNVAASWAVGVGSLGMVIMLGLAAFSMFDLATGVLRRRDLRAQERS